MGQDGLVVISLDTELGWGGHGFDETPPLSDDGQTERENITRLLDIFDEFETPATWAIVGHLFLESCDGTHGELVSPEWPSTGGWYAEDPGTDLERNPLRYGPDIVSAIESAAVDHEIATHTFSHVICSEPSVTPEVLRSELEASRNLAAQRGHEVSSLVFPRNEARHQSVLPEQGIAVYRRKSSARRSVETNIAGGVRRYLRFLAGRPAPVVDVERDDAGVWNLPASQRLSYNPGSDWITDRFSPHPRVKIARRAIETIARKGGIYHLWDHPHAFTPAMFRDLRKILEFTRKKSVDVVPMREAINRLTGDGGTDG